VKILVKCIDDCCEADDWHFNTPLTYAARQGRVEVVRALLEEGANVEETDVNTSTALHAAAWHGHLNVCRLLLDWGAKVDHVDRWKNTPLHDAAREGRLSVVKLLVERGADVGLKNDNGQTVSDLALCTGKKGVAEWLDSLAVSSER
jgi:ankyrin repeat protein